MKILKARIYNRIIRWAGIIQIYGTFIMSCKLKEKETGIENIQSYHKTSDLIEKKKAS